MFSNSIGGRDRMKTLPLISLLRRNYALIFLNAFLAIALTVVSFRYVHPKDCYRLCGTEDGIPCPSGSCNFGEQKAGWPIPAFVDTPGGGSPTGGWGLLGPEDPPLAVPIILDVLFYSILLWAVLCIIRFAGKQTVPRRLILATLPVNIFLAISLWTFYLLFAYFAPVGRGHSVQVYVNTPTSTTASLAFSPIVSIPVDELIEKYGDPDYVQLIADGTTDEPKTGMVLYWDSVDMFITLPEIANKTYRVQEKTNIELIIFSAEKDLVGIDDKPLREKKISWLGYGDYEP